MMDWASAGLLVLLVPLLMCALMMGGGVALAMFGFRRAGSTTRGRDRPAERSEPMKDRL